MYWTDIKISWDGLCSCQEHRLFKDNRFQNKSNKSRLKCRGELRSHAITLLYIFYQFGVPHFSVGKPQLILTSVCKLYYRSYRKKHIRRIASFFFNTPRNEFDFTQYSAESVSLKLVICWRNLTLNLNFRILLKDCIHIVMLVNSINDEMVLFKYYSFFFSNIRSQLIWFSKALFFINFVDVMTKQPVLTVDNCVRFRSNSNISKPLYFTFDVYYPLTRPQNLFPRHDSFQPLHIKKVEKSIWISHLGPFL